METSKIAAIAQANKKINQWKYNTEFRVFEQAGDTTQILSDLTEAYCLPVLTIMQNEGLLDEYLCATDILKQNGYVRHINAEVLDRSEIHKYSFSIYNLVFTSTGVDFIRMVLNNHISQ